MYMIHIVRNKIVVIIQRVKEVGRMIDNMWTYVLVMWLGRGSNLFMSICFVLP